MKHGLAVKHLLRKNYLSNKCQKSYHIYLEDKCLFKNLSQEEFDVVWDKIYKSYWTEDLSYSCCESEKIEQMESSY